MKKHLSETLIAVGVTLLLSTVGITATHASVNSENTPAPSSKERISSEPQATDNIKTITADNKDYTFAQASISSAITADAKAKIGFASVSVTSVPKPKPVVKEEPVVEENVTKDANGNNGSIPNAPGTPLTQTVPSPSAPAGQQAPAPAKVALPQNMNAYQKYAGEELARRGMGPAELSCLIPLWNKESGWNPNAANPSSSARGIPQMMMGIHYGLDWATNARGVEYLSNPEVQINVGIDYIQGRYQTPCNALNVWHTQSWY